MPVNFAKGIWNYQPPGVAVSEDKVQFNGTVDVDDRHEHESEAHRGVPKNRPLRTMRKLDDHGITGSKALLIQSARESLTHFAYLAEGELGVASFPPVDEPGVRMARGRAGKRSVDRILPVPTLLTPSALKPGTGLDPHKTNNLGLHLPATVAMRIFGTVVDPHNLPDRAAL